MCVCVCVCVSHRLWVEAHIKEVSSQDLPGIVLVLARKLNRLADNLYILFIPFIFQSILLLIYVFSEIDVIHTWYAPWCSVLDDAALHPSTIPVNPVILWMDRATVLRIGCSVWDCRYTKAPHIRCFMLISFYECYDHYDRPCQKCGGAALSWTCELSHICHLLNGMIALSPMVNWYKPQCRSLLYHEVRALKGSVTYANGPALSNATKWRQPAYGYRRPHETLILSGAATRLVSHLCMLACASYLLSTIICVYKLVECDYSDVFFSLNLIICICNLVESIYGVECAVRHPIRCCSSIICYDGAASSELCMTDSSFYFFAIAVHIMNSIHTVYLVILALLGQNGGKEIMAHIDFGSPRV